MYAGYSDNQVLLACICALMLGGVEIVSSVRPHTLVGSAAGSVAGSVAALMLGDVEIASICVRQNTEIGMV